jgi:cytochrome c oxidase cbb3-type subunit 3
MIVGLALPVWLQSQAAPAPQTPAAGAPPAAAAPQTPAAPRGRGAGGAGGGQAGRGGRQGGRGAASPASQRPPQTATPQTFPPEQIATGRTLFSGQCGFCHGRDAQGGESGPDLTRSTLVSEDVRGDRIGPVVKTGRTDKGMPAFPLNDTDLGAIVAFIHDQQAHASTQLGGRRSVDVADLESGNVDAGKRYFDSACASCHSATGDLKGIATKFQGLALFQRMLNPRTSGGRVSPAKVTVTPPNGPAVTGNLEYRDEFTIALTDDKGWYHSWPIRQVKMTISDPVTAHVDQLAKYTDADMHDVLAYLQTLK